MSSLQDGNHYVILSWLLVMNICFSLGKPLVDEYILSSYQHSGSGSGYLTQIMDTKQHQNIKYNAKLIANNEQLHPKKKSFFEFLSYYKRKVYPYKLDKQLVDALENHIEEMEPQFRSGSFSQLWNALREPLTECFRPKNQNLLVNELKKCLYGTSTQSNHTGLLPGSVENIRRDLIICKIAQILDGKSTRPVKELWGLLREPMTPLLVADLRTMVRELAQYASRFEMAGIQYELPGKMSEIRRDVVICKVDDVFNALYDTNFKELERDL